MRPERRFEGRNGRGGFTAAPNANRSIREQSLHKRLDTTAQNHAFIDGNKRTAFACTYTFLAINGFRLMADADQTWLFIADLYEANQFGFEKLVPWLRDNVAEETSGK